MPRGTTLVGLPQPTQSVQNKILLDTVPCDNGRNPAKLSGFRAFPSFSCLSRSPFRSQLLGGFGAGLDASFHLL